MAYSGTTSERPTTAARLLRTGGADAAGGGPGSTGGRECRRSGAGPLAEEGRHDHAGTAGRDAVSAADTREPALDAALEAWHDHAAVGEGASRPSQRAALTAHALALGFVVVAVVLAAHGPLPKAEQVAELVALTGLYV